MVFASEQYVSLTSFKKDGSPVALPVWIVQLSGNRYGFTTESHSYKVKRINANPRISLRPCNIKGVVHDDAISVSGQAYFTENAQDVQQVNQKLREKYGIRVSIIDFIYFIRNKITGKNPANKSGAVIITLDNEQN